jgi:hypothetical protein
MVAIVNFRQEVEWCGSANDRFTYLCLPLFCRNFLCSMHDIIYLTVTRLIAMWCQNGKQQKDVRQYHINSPLDTEFNDKNESVFILALQ